ncbi:inhibitor of Brome mosaic virus [Scheffersomyces spartinae]|uniref:Enhancer of translation termination 1 n=1 Tax=Scheffersomyces spartinae TaxID=45513 RepID=A0A9P8AGR2_9ASCO|nr:inhibitor of Brome mosaic virus [Scheffersomyces spartinae]KAG7192025.1 inhibitor of Brome mosaic virus [Scheffersomyces spartinae]
MAKRQLGLGKKSKTNKKQKVEDEETSAASTNELTVELDHEVDPNDEFSQLHGLWDTYLGGERDNELILNGIVNECDRLLRNSTTDKITDKFYAIYGVALSELAKFKTEEAKDVTAFFNELIDRLDTGLKKFPHSPELLFAKSKVLINQVPLQYISQLDLNSKHKDINVKELLDRVLQTYNGAESKAIEQKRFHLFNSESFEILQALDDTLEIIDNFGKDHIEADDDREDEGLGKNSDDDNDENGNEIKLDEDHSLYQIRESDEYNLWWREKTIVFLNQVKKDKAVDKALVLELNKLLGQSYLKESEGITSIYTTLMYDDDFEGEELEGFTKHELQKIAQELIGKALKYLEAAEDDDDPESWVLVSEAMISLANCYELESEDQESLYKKAEKRLERANKATQGRYQEELDNLLQN